MNRIALGLLACSSVVLPSIALGQTPAPAAAAPAQPKAPALKAGSPAPELKVEKFIKGEPIKGFEKGRVYVVEFWATWCGPCIASMPHISELQRHYKDKGVTICGVNVWEEKDYTEATFTKAESFVKERGDNMAYTVAFDGGAKFMQTNWMEAADQNGIPAAFVVDKKGVIAWIGHPMNLDMVLDMVVGDTWDIEKGPQAIKDAEKAYEDAGEKYTESLAAGEAAWEAAAKKYPILASGKRSDRFGAMLTAKHFKEAYALGHTLADEAIKAKNSTMLMEIAGAVDSPRGRPETFDADLVYKCGKGYFDLNDNGKDFGPYVVLARAQNAKGDKEAAKASAAKAVELANPEIRDRLKAWLDSQLETADEKKEEKKAEDKPADKK